MNFHYIKKNIYPDYIEIIETLARWVNNKVKPIQKNIEKEEGLVETLLKKLDNEVGISEISNNKDLSLFVAITHELARGDGCLALLYIASLIPKICDECLSMQKYKLLNPILNINNNPLIPILWEVKSPYLLIKNDEALIYNEDAFEKIKEIKQTGFCCGKYFLLKLSPGTFTYDEIGVKDAQKIKNALNILLVAVAQGMLENSIEILENWVESRVIKGNEPLGENSLIRELIGKIETTYITSLFSLKELVLFWTDDSIKISRISAKLLHDIQQAHQQALEPMASAGYAKEWIIERHWRNSRSLVNMIGSIPILYWR